MEININEKIENAIRDNNYQVAIFEIRDFLSHSDLPLREQGILIGEALLKVYDDFCVVPVHYIYTNLSEVLESDVKGSFDYVIKRHINATIDWVKKLKSLSKERYGRVIREYIRARRDTEALHIILKMFSPANEQANQTTANFLGTVFGSMINDLATVDTIIKQLKSYVGKNGITREIIDTIIASKDSKVKALYKTGLDTAEVEFTQEITRLAVELANYLPPKRTVSKLTDEEYEKFRVPVMAIFRIIFAEKSEEFLYDAIELLKEFTPKEHSATSKLAHIEQRLYNMLALGQRRVVMKVMEEVGNNHKIAKLMLSFAEKHKYEPIGESIIQVLGMMRNPEFVPFLVSALNDKKLEAAYNYIIMALGTIADLSSARTLLNELQKVFKKKYVEPEKRVTGVKILNALGRIFLLNPKMDYAMRNDIIKKVLNISPDDTEVNIAIGTNTLAFNPKEIEPDLMQEGVNRLTKSLWSQNPRATWASILDESDKPINFRQATIDAMLKIKDAASNQLQVALENNLGRPCGAYIAIADVIGEIKSESFIPILEKMLIETLSVDKLAPTTYGVEKIWDAKEGVERELTVNDIVTEIVDAVDKTGTERAYGILARFHKQVQKGEIKFISERTAKILYDAQKKGLLKEEETTRVEKKGRKTTTEMNLSDLSVDELVKMAKGPLVPTSKSIPQRVAAIEVIGSKPRIEAVNPFIKMLKEKNAIIRTSVINALSEYGVKYVNKYIRDEAFDELIQNLDTKNEKICSGILEVFKKIGLGNESLLNKIKQAQSIGSQKIKDELMKLFRRVSENGTVEYIGRGEAATGKLDEKRQYYLAYQEWIRGGKKGSPPEKPKDLE